MKAQYEGDKVAFMKLNLHIKVVIGIIILLSSVCSVIGVMTVVNVRHQLSTAIIEKAKSDAATSLAVIDVMYPGPWTIRDGILYKGNTKMNDNTEIVDKIAKLTEDTVTIFLNDTRISTTIVRDGKRAVGTKAADNVIDEVLNKGQIYRGAANVLGVNYHANYLPIKDVNGKIIGMFYLGVSKQFADELEQGFIIKFIGTILISVLLFSLVGWYLGRKLSRPIGEMSNMIGQVAEGNLGVNEIAITSKDEIGQLGQGLNTMLRNLRKLVVHISNSASTIAASSEELTASAQQSADAATQVAGSITEIAAGSDQQAVAVNTMSATVEAMSAGIEQIAATSKEIAEIAVDTSQSTENGRQAIDKVVEQMKSIGSGANEVQETISKLAQGSREIGEIVTLISSIASQTNLLALNAAIEAARAGEVGRGFAVVAEEVRKLAEESNQAAQRISSLIQMNEANMNQAITATQTSNEGVKAGIELVGSAGATFNVIAGAVRRLSLQIKDVSQSIEQIANGSQELVSSVCNIEKISKDNATETQSVSAATEEQSASMQEIAASSQALAQIAEELQSAVANFKI